MNGTPTEFSGIGRGANYRHRAGQKQRRQVGRRAQLRDNFPSASMFIFSTPRLTFLPGIGKKVVIKKKIISGSDMSISFRNDSDEEKDFREEVRDWITTTLPDDLRGWSTRPPFERTMWWHRKLYGKGWIAPAWPKLHGGMEATLNEQIILKEELARAGAPEISAQGINHVGPILMALGPANRSTVF